MNSLKSVSKFNERQNVLLGAYQGFYDAIYGQPATMQVVDGVLYAAKSVGAVSSFADLFKRDDSILIGKTNVKQAQLDANTVFLVTGIALQYVVAAGTTDDNVRQAAYGVIPTNLRNGEITIRSGNRPICDKLPCEVFHNAQVAVGDTNAAAGSAITYTMVGNIGVYELENPKWIFPNEIIDVDLRMAGALDSNGAVKILLFGAKNASL